MNNQIRFNHRGNGGWSRGGSRGVNRGGGGGWRGSNRHHNGYRGGYNSRGSGYSGRGYSRHNPNRSLPDKIDRSDRQNAAVESGAFKNKSTLSAPVKSTVTTSGSLQTSPIAYQSDDDDDEETLKIYEGSTEEEGTESEKGQADIPKKGESNEIVRKISAEEESEAEPKKQKVKKTEKPEATAVAEKDKKQSDSNAEKCPEVKKDAEEKDDSAKQNSKIKSILKPSTTATPTKAKESKTDAIKKTEKSREDKAKTDQTKAKEKSDPPKTEEKPRTSSRIEEEKKKLVEKKKELAKQKSDSEAIKNKKEKVMIIDDAKIIEEERKEQEEMKRNIEMLKSLKAARKSTEMEERRKKEEAEKKKSDENGKKADDKIRTILNSSGNEKDSDNKNGEVSAATRAILEKGSDKKKNDTTKTPPPPPPKGTKSISLTNFSAAKKDGKKDAHTRASEGKKASLDKRNSNSPTARVQSKITSFASSDKKDDAKIKRKDSIDKNAKGLKEDESSQRRSSRRKPESEKDTKKEKSKNQTVMSEDLFDMEIRKSQAQENSKEKRKEETKKRNSVVDSDEEPVPKRRKGSDNDGLLSPTRRVSTSFSARQERRKSDLARKQSIEDIPTALDLHPSADGRNDFYCWICHLEGEVICCDVCPRVYHENCMPRVKGIQINAKEFFCPECTRIQDAENLATRTPTMKNISIPDLSLMLKNAVEAIRPPGVEIFLVPVDTTMNPNYPDYIFHPMDLGTVAKKIKIRGYGSTDAFLADIKWIQHNCCIFNGLENQFSVIAKKIVRLAEKECQDIESCPGCYKGPIVSPTDWFTVPCEKIHPIVWGKIAGYPIWPGKAVGSSQQTTKDSGKTAKTQVDIRFFGQHDRAWVNVTNVYCFSKDEPQAKPKQQKKEYEMAMKELNEYCNALRNKYGQLKHYPVKTQFDPSVHFERSSIFNSLTGENKSALSDVPKIPPLVKPPTRRPNINETIAKVSKTFPNLPKDKKPKSDSSDEDISIASPTDCFDFNSNDDEDEIDLKDDRKKPKDSKKEEKKQVTETPTRPAKRPRSESPLDKTEQCERRSSRNRTESPRPIDKDTKIPPPPPKTTKSKDEPSKNAYSQLEKDRKRKEAEKKKPDKVESPKVTKPYRKEDLPTSDFLSNLDMTYPSRNATDLKNTIPVQGLPPGILLGNYKDKVMNNITAVLKDVYQEILKSMDGNGHVDALRLEVDRLKWQHEMELNEMRHNHELTIAEIRQSVENEKKNAIEELRKKLEKEKSDAILETKKKQWCANCGKEAVFYCCWNTSYCDYPCQQGHWPVHMASCSQGSSQQGNQRPT